MESGAERSNEIRELKGRESLINVLNATRAFALIARLEFTRRDATRRGSAPSPSPSAPSGCCLTQCSPSRRTVLPQNSSVAGDYKYVVQYSNVLSLSYSYNVSLRVAEALANRMRMRSESSAPLRFGPPRGTA